MGKVRVKTEASIAVVLLRPSKKSEIFKVMANTPTAINFGKSCFDIFTFLLADIKNGAKKKQAKANLKKIKLIGGNSCKVIFATTKFAPQIRWASIKAK